MLPFLVSITLSGLVSKDLSLLTLLLTNSLGSFSNDDGDGNGNEDVKRSNRFIFAKTATLHAHHAFLYISLPSLRHYDVKMPNCKFYGGRKQATTNLFFSF